MYHLHDLQLNLIGEKLKHLPHRPVVIYDVHEDYYQLFSDSAGNSIIRLLQKPFLKFIDKWEKTKAGHYDEVIAAVDHIKNRFTSAGKVTSCTVIYNYTFFSLQQSTTELMQEKKYDLVYAGMMSAQRGIRELLLAIAFLQQKGVSLRLLLIGSFSDNQFERQIRHLIDEKNIASSVTVKAQVPFNEIHLYYQQSRAGIALFLPTLTSKILMPIKLFEYLSFGLPVLSSDTGYTAEFVRKNKCGITCNPVDTEAVAGSMLRLLNDKDLYHTLQKNSLAAAAEHSWKSQEKALLDLYTRLLHERILLMAAQLPQE